MEFVLLLSAALVPALALLFAPRAWLKGIAAIAVGLFVLCVIWTVSFSNSCTSDGCIGVIALVALTATLGLSVLLAGAIRLAVIALRRRQDHPEE